MQIRLPEGVRCAVALSYDLEMCGGYQPDGVNHVLRRFLEYCGNRQEKVWVCTVRDAAKMLAAG